LKNFGLIIGTIFIIISILLYWKDNQLFPITLFLGSILLISAVIYPLLLKYVYWAWISLGNILSWFITRIILSLLYYFVFTSIGLMGRIINKNFLDLKLNKSNKTYWNERIIKNKNKQSYEKQY